MHGALDKAAEKVVKKTPAKQNLVGQVDALIDTLYFTYGSFVLMGVDPERILILSTKQIWGRFFPDGKAHFDPVTHKILKPDDWKKNILQNLPSDRNYNVSLKAYERHKERKNKNKRKFFSLDEKFGDFLS